MDDNTVTSTLCRAISKTSFALVKNGGKNSNYTKDKAYDCIIRHGVKTAIVKDDEGCASEMPLDQAQGLFDIKED